LCKRFRIDNSKREKHTALIDCELLSKVYINLIDQKEPKLNFNNLIDTKKNETNKKNTEYSKKIIIPSTEEIKNHKEFLKNNFKRNFF
jgi:DNA polymerase III, epsilon subunit and related 3''-5'' exonucleases